VTRPPELGGRDARSNSADVVKATRELSPPTDRASLVAILRQLAALTEALEPGIGTRHPRRSSIERLSPATLCELADLLAAGKSPTIGWWKRAYETSRRCDP
jgi:hypothetical protein